MARRNSRFNDSSLINLFLAIMRQDLCGESAVFLVNYSHRCGLYFLIFLSMPRPNIFQHRGSPILNIDHSRYTRAEENVGFLSRRFLLARTSGRKLTRETRLVDVTRSIVNFARTFSRWSTFLQASAFHEWSPLAVVKPKTKVSLLTDESFTDLRQCPSVSVAGRRFLGLVSSVREKKGRSLTLFAVSWPRKLEGIRQWIATSYNDPWSNEIIRRKQLDGKANTGESRSRLAVLLPSF